MLNKKLLKSKMALYGDTYETLSEAIKIARGTLCQKVNGNNEFTRKEISDIAKRYNLTDAETVDVFGLRGD